MMLLWLAACAPRSPMVATLHEIWTKDGNKGEIFAALRQREPPFADRSLQGRLRRWFRHEPDDLWLAETLLVHGPEPLWTAELLQERRERASQGGWAPERGPIRGVLGRTDEGRPVEAWFVEGRTSERALVLGGVHGSEASGIEVVELLVEELREGEPPGYTVVLIPALFPDHAAQRLREDRATPTNRNFPPPGTSFARSGELDALGRPILPENRMFLEVIERFEPTRLASVHATVRPGAAGVFSDVHTTGPSAEPQEIELATRRSAEDEALALSMARAMAEAGHLGSVPGNHLDTEPIAEWSGGVDGGISLGGWGPRAVSEGGPGDRPSLTVITVEMAEQHRSDDLQAEAQLAREAELRAMADVLRHVFLEP
jgi:predicted deacylase